MCIVEVDTFHVKVINTDFFLFQKCDDMFLYSKWNGTTTYGFGNNERDFGTDYGICCW